jgi:hypothetical protein
VEYADMGAEKSERVLVGYCPAETPSQVIADAIIAAQSAAKRRYRDDLPEPPDTKPIDARPQPDRRVARRYAADSRSSPDHADAGLGDRRRKAAEFWSHLNGCDGQADKRLRTAVAGSG